MKQDKEAVYRKYKQSINMSYTQLLRWSRSPCSRKASLNRKPIARNLRLLKKKKDDWTHNDVIDANKTIAFVARMRAVPSGRNISSDCPISRRDASLKNWAYDPKKK
jgi:hypothetical protein